MRRLTLALAAALASLQPAAAQNFFERLFGPPQGVPPHGQGLPPQYRQQPQYLPQPQPGYQPRFGPQPPPQRRSQPQQPPQQRPAQPQQPPQQQAEPAPAAEPPPAPYEKELLRLAEIMGSLALLRPLCTAPDAGEWSRRMQFLLEAEGSTP
ncbi:MAG TPA: TIGR02301 family protein, partial [Geminicoccaceae bacterium]